VRSRPDLRAPDRWEQCQNRSFCGESPTRRLVRSNSQLSGLKKSSQESKSEVAINRAASILPRLKKVVSKTVMGLAVFDVA
jgi:hypothetical protein